ncbi:hypothetical protein WA1_37700 [Scytonema hofmannii PCC 7110]|uniref:Uncharacterized protein n=1 Tax=Scytonema hofmannii PCC 7110 TaxID=128403 RepID=A0A139X057_9CYAN|nr:hypothetical protein WA1_37700 [Scytonema hofmannii PCC 7110]
METHIIFDTKTSKITKIFCKFSGIFWLSSEDSILVRFIIITQFLKFLTNSIKIWLFSTCYAKITSTEEGTGNRERGTVKKETKFSVCLA